MKAFLVGLGIGVGLGVLFAPMSGERTRENLAQRAGDLADSARGTYEQGRDRVQKGIGAIRNIAGSEGTQRPTGTETPNL
jgi:gas vesicle protein